MPGAAPTLSQPHASLDPTTPARLRALADRWAGARAAERANAQSYLIELCEALGVERPRPAGSGYEFEYPVRVVNRDGTETTNFVDLIKLGHFVLEAKDDASGKAGSASHEVLLRKAFGQARAYAAHLPGAPPPYLLVLDVAKTLTVWDRWSGSYGGFSAGRTMNLRTLAERDADVALLRDIFEDPAARDPRAKAAAVTEEIAATLAELAASLERRGHGQEQVARYLMRCVFTMFAEDVGLLRDEPFRQAIEEAGLGGSPEEFGEAVAELWAAMDEGRRFGLRKLLRFNGHFFKDRSTIRLTREDLVTLKCASEADWQHVEPSIFGTLLTRALDPAERHRLGAEYTPRAFIERVVRPAIEEPIRERWTAVEAEVLQLTERARERGRKKDLAVAVERLDAFHDWLRGLRFLDPACGSGNFLYVTLALVKDVELEVVRAREALTGQGALRIEEVNPAQFYGLEVKAWAREIAELTLWIGFHQFWKAHHAVQPPEPVLQDTGTLEHRDAVLAWDAVRHDPARDRPDPAPRIRHPVTGALVPDPAARLRYDAYEGVRPAAWPEADFIVGNPPFMGQFRQRDALGDGYVEALRAAYPEVPDAADLVMYWVYKAAQAVASGRTLRAGLITTQSVTQQQNRRVFEDAAASGVRPAWAIADHYWNDGADDARVRVAMTVLAKMPEAATLVTVDGEAAVVATTRVPRLNVDLTTHADVPTAVAVPLLANAGLCSNGYKPHGTGFLVPAAEAQRLLALDARHADVLRPYRNGMDLATRPRDVWIVDFGFAAEDEARAYPLLFDLVRDRVKPERDANAQAAYRQFWWRFGRPRAELREALRGLSRYIATVKTAKHRLFTFLDAAIAPDDKLTCVASSSALHLGVLSSGVHRAWALAAGSRLGIDGTPSYDKGACFDAFPFPDPTPALAAHIADVAERIDTHRKQALDRDARLGMTLLYNVVDKLRADESLSPKEREAHALAACGTLRDLHDDLDRLVAEAYGWAWPLSDAVVLERLVPLHDLRREEERGGTVRWLRPAFQVPRLGAAASGAGELALTAGNEEVVSAASGARLPWPGTAIEQIAALKAIADAGPVTIDRAVAQFAGARRDLVARHLETLAIMGEVQQLADGRYGALTTAA